MSGKNRVILLAIATAGLIGAMAPAAYAAGPGGNSNSVLNISGNQLPIQACNDVVPVNGVGGDVPLAGIAAALSVLSAGSTNLASSDTSCHQSSAQADTTTTTTGTDAGTGTGTGTDSGTGTGRQSAGGNSNSVINLSNNQLPIQLCNDTVPVNGVGGLVPAQGLAGVLSILSPGSILSAFQDSSCTATSDQTNADTTTANG
jgi:hypothetical protein